jgi:predicted MFS family arabinose efflux permease
MAAVFILSTILLRWLPQAATSPTAHDAAPENPAPHHLGMLPHLCLGAVFLFYISVGGLWAYIERIGRSGGLSETVVTASLSYTQLLSLLGCIVAGWLSGRVGQSRPLIVSLLFTAVAILSLSLGITTLSFIVVLCVFFFLWNAIDVYQLGTLSNIDHSGRYAAMVPAFQMTAAALGPAVAAGLLTWQANYRAVLIVAALCIFCATLLYSYVHFRQRAEARL